MGPSAANERANPFAAPSSEVAPIAGPPDDGTGLLLRWERLRLVYNAILLGTVVAVVAAALILGGLRAVEGRVVGILGSCVVGCAGANLCFCIGPVANAYACWIGLKDRVVTYIIFVAGVLVSIPLAAGMVGVQILGAF